VTRLAFALSSALCLSAGLDPCTLGPSTDDGGGGSGSSSGGAPPTIGSQCTAIVEEFCTQAVQRCALAGFTVSDCVTNDMPDCCSVVSGTCNQTSNEPASAVDTCKSDIDTEDCNFVVNSTLPDSCQALLHP
jgi:hypothetical protein